MNPLFPTDIYWSHLAAKIEFLSVFGARKLKNMWNLYIVEFDHSCLTIAATLKQVLGMTFSSQ
jgi:hypothetical protein